MPFYNKVATEEAVRFSQTADQPALRSAAAHAAGFPAPRHVWIDFVCDGLEQWDAYRHLAPVTGRRLLQVGGKGAHAVKSSSLERGRRGTRYPLIALEKSGVPLNATLAWWIMKIDDAFSSLIPGLRNLGSGAVLIGTR